MLKPEQILNDTYKIIEQIGSGGGGIIYKAYHLRMRKDVAIKLIKNDLKGKINNRSEVDMLKNLKNDYLPQVIDFVEDGEDVYTVMEYIDGMNFRQLIERGGHFTEKQVKKYALQLCEAVEYLHNHVPPIIHSDIKPANVMLTPQDNICLIDFNISMMTGNGKAVSVGGSQGFGAPEQFKKYIELPVTIDDFHEDTRFVDEDETEILLDESFQPAATSSRLKTKNMARAFIDIRTDIYGIGATVYYMLTGRVPQSGRLDFRGISCSAKLREVIEKAMAPVPAERYKNVAELKRSLKSNITFKPVFRALKTTVAIFGVVMGVSAVAIICFVIVGKDRNKNNDANLSENIMSLTDINQNNLKWVITAQTKENVETTVPVTEETEGLSTIVPGMETDDNRNDFVKMPSLLGKDYTEAIRILNTMGLSYKITYSDKKYDDIGENCVFSQMPASGNEVNQDSVVELGISNYKTTTTQKPITESTVTSASQTTTKLSTTNTKKVTEKHTNASTVNSVEVKEVYTVYFHVHEDVIPVDVIKGDDAVPPSVKSNTEYKFIGWDGDYQNVTENRDVFALFETVETTTTETTTTIDTTALQVDYDGDITLLLSFNTYSLDIFNVPIEGTTWEDYYWTSSNEVCVQIFSGILQTYYEGETTLTLTYINNPSIVATTKFRVVSKIN